MLKEHPDQKYVEIAQSELDNAISTLENLLHVSKPDLEDEPYVPVSMCAELETIFHLFQDQIYRVEITKDFRNTDVKVIGKRNQLKKALFNLLKNAFEAIPNQGTIKVEHYLEGDSVVITIEDTGVGIPPEKLKILGTPFFTTKTDGTGMGLTQVFSVVYQHAGSIQVHSVENHGTKFIITLPKEAKKECSGVVHLPLRFTEGQDLRGFFLDNRDQFERYLLDVAVNVRDKIDEILQIGNIDLLANAHKLVLYIVEGREHDVMAFAKTEGVAWAKYSLTLAFKLEWIQAIRRVLWDFLYNFDRRAHVGLEVPYEHFYSLEKRINQQVDQFLNYFFISYTEFKDKLIQKQRDLVEDLSVPIIPITAGVCILPLIGMIDSSRAHTIEEKVISHIGDTRIETLIIDLSGVVDVESEALHHLSRILDGMAMMGCSPVLTGLRPKVVKQILRSGLSFTTKETKGTLQQALVEYLK